MIGIESEAELQQKFHRSGCFGWPQCLKPRHCTPETASTVRSNVAPANSKSLRHVSKRISDPEEALLVSKGHLRLFERRLEIVSGEGKVRWVAKARLKAYSCSYSSTPRDFQLNTALSPGRRHKTPCPSWQRAREKADPETRYFGNGTSIQSSTSQEGLWRAWKADRSIVAPLSPALPPRMELYIYAG